MSAWSEAGSVESGEADKPSGAGLMVAFARLLADNKADCGQLVTALTPFIEENGAALKALNSKLMNQDQATMDEMTKVAAELAPFAQGASQATEACGTNPEFGRLMMKVMPD